MVKLCYNSRGPNRCMHTESERDAAELATLPRNTSTVLIGSLSGSVACACSIRKTHVK